MHRVTGQYTHGYMRTETHTSTPTGTCTQRHRPAHPQVHMHSSADEHAHKHMCIETQDSTPAGTCAQQYICLSSSPVLAFIAPINTRTKSNLGGNEFVWIPFPGHHPSLKEVRAGNQGRNLETRTEGEAMEECCGFDCFLWLAQPPFLYYPGPPAHHGVSPHCLTLNFINH